MSKTEKEKQGAGQQPEKKNAVQSTEKKDAGQKPEKIVTSYDRKMQRRKEEKEKALRDKRIARATGIVFLVALVCIAASFPIRTWMSLNSTYVEINGEKITRVEYDYNYSMVSSNFISQYYTTYLYFGVDLTGDLSKMMYSETLTWKDYFDEMTVQSIAQNKAMLKEAKAEGFVYDTADDFSEYKEVLKAAAAGANVSQKDYIRQMYGPYATESRIKPYLEESMYLTAYGDEVLEERFTPSQEEIEKYYEENRAGYDAVDYYVAKADAQLPTEPTELADPPEDAEEEGGEDAAEGGTEDEPYQPSEAEIAAAMEEAKEEAEAALEKLAAEGDLNTNMKKTAVTYILQSWLFDDARKPGDTTVIEDSTNHRYYAVEFKDRYRDKAHTVDARLVITENDNAQAVLDEWKSGAATEESFGEICDKYNDPATVSAKGGLQEALTAAGLSNGLAEWLFDEARKAGDASVISEEGSEYSYVVYYVGLNEEEWIVNIKNQLLNQEMQFYLTGLAENMEVRDPGGNMNYLKVREEEAEASREAQEGSSSGEETGESGESGSEEGSDSAGGESGSEEDSDGADEGSDTE